MTTLAITTASPTFATIEPVRGESSAAACGSGSSTSRLSEISTDAPSEHVAIGAPRCPTAGSPSRLVLVGWRCLVAAVACRSYFEHAADGAMWHVLKTRHLLSMGSGC